MNPARKKLLEDIALFATIFIPINIVVIAFLILLKNIF